MVLVVCAVCQIGNFCSLIIWSQFSAGPQPLLSLSVQIKAPRAEPQVPSPATSLLDADRGRPLGSHADVLLALCLHFSLHQDFSLEDECPLRVRDPSHHPPGQGRDVPSPSLEGFPSILSSFLQGPAPHGSAQKVGKVSPVSVKVLCDPSPSGGSLGREPPTKVAEMKIHFSTVPQPPGTGVRVWGC